jgi:lipopolysaccharide transport system ATP-binding protein
MPSSDIAIKVENLSKCYHIYDKPHERLKQILAHGRKQYFREFWALKDVSFDVKRGETVGIVGRNGSGKSTLLQLICGTLKPTQGSVTASGRIAALLELGSGFNPDFSGRENVYLNGNVLGLDQDEIDERFDSIVAFADTTKFIDQPVKTYSSGMLVRLAFAIQSQVNPDILVVDEALAVGDEKFQRKCFGRIEELKRNGTSILFVSHSGPQVIELCDKAILIERGEKIMHTCPQTVVRSYQRLIYAPEAEQEDLLQNLRQGNLYSKVTASIATACQITSVVGLCEDNDAEHQSADDWFDPGLVPETTTVYPEQGARIERIQILDADNHVVNVLRARERYRIVVSGRFLNNFEEVYFAVHIRSISGVVISGQRHPEEGKYVHNPKAGNQFKIGFWFNMDLPPDIYFAGGGVWSSTDPACAHRILDAMMFRIQSDKSQSSFGYCNLMSGPAELELIG